MKPFTLLGLVIHLLALEALVWWEIPHRELFWGFLFALLPGHWNYVWVPPSPLRNYLLFGSLLWAGLALARPLCWYYSDVSYLNFFESNIYPLLGYSDYPFRWPLATFGGYEPNWIFWLFLLVGGFQSFQFSQGMLLWGLGLLTIWSNYPIGEWIHCYTRLLLLLGGCEVVSSSYLNRRETSE